MAEDAGQWVGIVGGFVDSADLLRRVELISMWIAPVYRPLGAGRDLLERLIVWARERGAQEVMLWVTETNAPAIGLYQCAGFRDTGARQPSPSHPHLMEQQMVLSVS